jgi:hypothetical protein
VVERVDEHGPGALGELGGRGDAAVDVLADEVHPGAVAARGADLRDRGLFGHEHRGLDAEHLGGQRHPLGVVARARGHHSAGALLVVEPGDAGVGATDLERSGALQVLALQPHRPAAQLAQRTRTGHRGGRHDPSQ